MFVAKIIDIIEAVELWAKVAQDNGWDLGSVTVWLDREGDVVDSVGGKDGHGIFLLMDEERDMNDDWDGGDEDDAW